MGGYKTMDAAAAKHVGARVLGEVEEESLEEVRATPLSMIKLLHQEAHRDVRVWESCQLQFFPRSGSKRPLLSYQLGLPPRNAPSSTYHMGQHRIEHSTEPTSTPLSARSGCVLTIISYSF